MRSLALAAAGAALACAAFAAGGARAAPTLGVYRCGAEEVVVAHCDISCEVDYPDRPKRNGFTVQQSEPLDALAARLQACRLTQRIVDGVPVGPAGDSGPISGAPNGTTPADVRALREGAAALGYALSGERPPGPRPAPAPPAPDCYERLARRPDLAPLAADVDLGHAVTTPNRKFQIAARPTPVEVQLLVRWLAGRQACFARKSAETHYASDAERRLDAQAAQVTDGGIRELAAGKLTYGQFNSGRARITLEVQRRFAALAPAAQAPANPAAAKRVCQPGDLACFQAQNPTDAYYKAFIEPYNKPYVEPYVKPYAPPPIGPGAPQ